MFDPFNWNLATEPVADEPVIGQQTSEEIASLELQEIPATPEPSVETAVTNSEQISVAVSDNLWERLRQGMLLTNTPQVRFQQELDWYARHGDYIKRVTERAQPYLFHIVEQVEQYNMPLELALLPIVESAFKPFAYSPGRAAGLWQFIPSTGRMYGLQQNWWYDGRRDVDASTQAALTYLKKLHKQFNGDWLLAVAAYNCGEGTLAKAIRKNKAAGKATDFFSLQLPRETRAYVPRLLAISELVKNPSLYNVSLTPIKNEVRLARVDAGSQIDLAKVAELSNISLEQLYQLNPGFNRWATAPEGPHSFVIPVSNKQHFITGLAALPDGERLSWKRHKIKQGETLSTIALKYKTSITNLRSSNKIKGSAIRAGKYLLIPVSSQPAQAYVLSSDGRQQRRLKRKGNGQKQIIEVQANDTLWDLSRSWNVSVKRLCAWNGIAPTDILHPGQQLVLWSSKSVQKPSKPVVLNNQLPTVPKQSVTYKVRNGDSLWTISRRFSVSINDLCAWNKLTPTKMLQPGQRLKLIVDVTQQSGTANI